MRNLIETQLTETDWTKIDEFLTGMEGQVAGKLAVLAKDDRSRYGSINEQNKLVVNKVRDYRQGQPALSSPDIDWEQFEQDFQSRLFLEIAINRMLALVYSFQSTKMLHDYDNLQDALKDYAYSQYKNGAGEDGFTAKVDELKQFFNRTGKTNTETEPETEPDNNI